MEIEETNVALLQCTCKNEWQDKRYGKGVRLHNRMGKTDKFRCTVCGFERSK